MDTVLLVLAEYCRANAHSLVVSHVVRLCLKLHGDKSIQDKIKLELVQVLGLEYTKMNTLALSGPGDQIFRFMVKSGEDDQLSSISNFSNVC